nr:hypothetical protein [Tanacetum cinerariifolium]
WALRKANVATPGEPDLPALVLESFHEQTDEELTETHIKRMDADNQAIQTILLGLPEDVYADAKLFNEWEKFTSTVGESIESYYHRFMQLMNNLKRNKHFPKNTASNLKFLNNLQPEWKRHVTIVRQTKNLHETDFTQIYDFLKMNQEVVNELRAERLAKSHNPLALMAHSQSSFNFPTTYKEQSSSSTHSQQSFPINNKYNPQTSLNQNFMQPPITSLEDINNPIEAMNTALILFAKAFQLFNVGGNGGNQVGQYAGQVAQNQQGFNAWQNDGIQGAQNAGVQSGGNQNGLVVVPRIANQSEQELHCRPRRRDAVYLQTQVLIAQKEEVGIQLLAEEFDFMAVAGDLDEIEEVNANCIAVYGSTRAYSCTTTSATNDNHVTFVAPSMVQSGGTVETSFAPNEETRAHQETVYHNLVDQVAQVNMVNCNMRATNAELKFELARYKIQEQRVKISQEKYDKLEKSYQKSVYQEQCLTKKINVLHLSFAKQITTLNDEISNLNKQISKEKSSISSLMEEKKNLKHDFKTQEDKFLDKEVDLEARIKYLENILLKRDQTVQTIHMLNPKPDSFYHPNQKMALGYPNPSYLKKIQLKQQSLYNGDLLLVEHNPPVVYDLEETLGLAQERVFVPQTTKSTEELFWSNVSNMVTVSKMISIPNEDLSDDTTIIISHEIAPIIYQVDARVQNSEIQFLQEASKFVRDFKSLAEEANESLDKQKSLELKIDRLLKGSVSHDIMSIVQNGFVNALSDLRTELDQCKYDKILYDKAYNDMQQKVERLQAQLRDLKVTMEILLEPTSNKLLVGVVGDFIWIELVTLDINLGPE